MTPDNLVKMIRQIGRVLAIGYSFRDFFPSARDRETADGKRARPGHQKSSSQSSIDLDQDSIAPPGE
jgi:hypothetical protein